MTDQRLANKIRETKAIASEQGLDLVDAPLLVTFEMPIWGAAVATHEISELEPTLRPEEEDHIMRDWSLHAIALALLVMAALVVLEIREA